MKRSSGPKNQTDAHAAFETQLAPHVPKLRSVIRRMVGHPEDTDDLVQEALLLAFRKLETFRNEAQPSTWLCAIGTRVALDYLRGRKQWRPNAQLLSEHEAHLSEANMKEVAQIMASPDYAFDVREHIAYCFTCVARTLEPEPEAALILREVMGYSNREAAQILGLSESVLRHRLSEARATMRRHFDALCALVNKRGPCWQCKGLRDLHPEEKRGPQIPQLGRDEDERDQRYQVRLRIVRSADVDTGRAQAFHDLSWRRMARTEEARNFEGVLGGDGPDE